MALPKLGRLRKLPPGVSLLLLLFWLLSGPAITARYQLPALLSLEVEVEMVGVEAAAPAAEVLGLALLAAAALFSDPEKLRAW